MIRRFLENPLWLAPMAGVTDKAFRTLCLRHGAGLTYSEMASAKGLHYGAAATYELVEPAPSERSFAVQLFGSDADIMAEQAAEVESRLGSRLALVDVNMGCPVAKVVRHGEGSALMKDPALAAHIIASMRDAVSVPVTAKFRSGWADGDDTAPEFAKRLEQAGAALVAVHGRSARQMYRGKADWGIIAAVKDAVSIPVAGSGDVWSCEDARAMMDRTGADAVMVARGARGNPWIFSGDAPSAPERLDAIEEHVALYVEFFGTEHLQPLRSQLPHYIKGLDGAARLRQAFSEASSYEDFMRVVADARERTMAG